MPPSILILDADAYLAGMYARRFEARQWRVRVAETVEEARKAVEREVPDAILIDTEAVQGGVGALHAWRSSSATAGVKLVVLTALGDREAVARAKREGADAYVLKGHFVPSEVCDKVEALVAGARA